MKTFFAFIFALTSTLSCVEEKTVSDENAEEFYSEKLGTDDSKACNDRGYFFDPLEKKCFETGDYKIKLATWTCDMDGLLSVTSESNNVDVFSIINGNISEGFEFDQCGQSELYASIIMTRKSKQNGEASIEILSYNVKLDFEKVTNSESNEKNTDEKTDEEVLDSLRSLWSDKDILITRGGEGQVCLRMQKLPGSCQYVKLLSNDTYEGPFDDECDIFITDMRQHIALTCKKSIELGGCRQFKTEGPMTITEVNLKTKLDGSETEITTPIVDELWKIGEGFCDDSFSKAQIE